MAELREAILAATDLIGMSLQARLAADIGAVVLGQRVDGRGLGQLMRSERNNFVLGSASVVLVPALVARTLAPAAGVVATSSMPAPARVIAGLTPRVSFLRALISLTNIPSAELRPDGQALIARMARRVPGAAEPGQSVDLSRARAAALTEIAILEPLDDEERQEAGLRLAVLDAQEQFFGVAP